MSFFFRLQNVGWMCVCIRWSSAAGRRGCWCLHCWLRHLGCTSNDGEVMEILAGREEYGECNGTRWNAMELCCGICNSPHPDCKQNNILISGHSLSNHSFIHFHPMLSYITCNPTIVNFNTHVVIWVAIAFSGRSGDGRNTSRHSTLSFHHPLPLQRTNTMDTAWMMKQDSEGLKVPMCHQMSTGKICSMYFEC